MNSVAVGNACATNGSALRPSFRLRGLFAIAALALLAVATPALARDGQAPRAVMTEGSTSSAGTGLQPVALTQADVALVSAQEQFDNIKVRLAALRSSARRDTSGLAFGPSGQAGPFGTSFQQMTLVQDESAQADAGANFSPWGFFVAGTFGEGDADAGLVSPGVDFDSAGLTAGLDYRHSDHWVLGATVGISMTDTNLELNQGTHDSDGWSVSGYSTYVTDNNWYADAILSYGQTTTDMRRVIITPQITIGQTLTSRSDSSHVSFATSFGGDFSNGAWGYGPYARLQYTSLEFDSFVENITGVGPLTPQAIAQRDFTSFSSVIGGKLTYVNSTASGVIIPHLQLEWQHEFEDDAAIVDSTTIGGGTTTIVGDDVDGSFGRVGLGLSMVFTHGRSAFFLFERTFGRDRYSLSSLAVGLRAEF